MIESPVVQNACATCGAAVGPNSVICPDCAKALGSVIIVPAPTTIRAEPRTAQTPTGLRKFNDYEIQSELARGGMGVVYVARQLSLNRLVALKMILTPFAGEDEKRRFRAEAEHTATLEHPNIIPVYDSGEADGMPFYTMKLVQGRCLNAELRRLFLEPRKSATILATVARAVHYAHQHGILHRDLKPHNILIDAQGTPFVGDFGLSKRVENTDAGDATQVGAVMGTPQYMSPEQAAGQTAKISVATDVYSLGAILYEMLTLRQPFVAGTKWEILQKVKSEEAVPPHKLRATVNRDLETICLKCLEKDPARRYASALDVALDLERWLRGVPILARPHTVWERGMKWVRRHPATASSAALAAACVLIVAGFYWRSNALVHEAELRRTAQRVRAADEAKTEGSLQLQTARDAAQNGAHSADGEKALIEAEDRFRSALFNVPGDAVASVGLRETALLSFDTALRVRNWRQAREKLLLARSAGMDAAEFDAKQKDLAKLESERGDHIRARVKALMDDAASPTRSVTHEMAVYELIAMKDDLTVELLRPYIGHNRPECRLLACSALPWIGDASLVPALLTQINPTTPFGANNPANVQAAAIIAVCMLAADGDTFAYNTVRNRISADPADKNSLLYFRVKLQFDNFARRHARVTKAAPDDSPARLLEHAQRAIDSDNASEALKLFERLVELEPENVTYICKRGAMRQSMGDLAGAMSDYNEVIRRAPNERDGYIHRGELKSFQKDAVGALADLNKAVEISPNESGLLATRGLIRKDLGDMTGAMADYNRALELDPDNLYALTNRAGALCDQKEFTKSLDDYDRALALSPMFMQALTGRACTRQAVNDVDGAIADFDKTLALNPNQEGCYYNRALMKCMKADWTGAIRDYDRYLEMMPSNFKGYYNRGVTKGEAGDMKGAVRDYEKAIELEPNHPEPFVNLGYYY